MPKKVIGKGAEAIIYCSENRIIKERVAKAYRIKELDVPLRKSRTKKEAKILERLSAKGFPAPSLMSSDSMSIIEMEYISGRKVRDILEESDFRMIGREIGRLVRILHENGTIHGDLTTSNMILSRGRVFLIDFGLSFFSEKEEDMAVDIHLLRQALESRHHSIFNECFAEVKIGYGKKAVLKRLESVEMRGRNKQKRLPILSAAS